MEVAPLSVRLFGPLSVVVRGEPMPRVRTRSVEWLLALLVLRHGRPVDRSWLAGTLWPESIEAQALKNLRDDLVRLRAALGPESERIQSPNRSALTFELSDADVDLLVFDSGIRAGDEDSLRAAVDLYSGRLLDGCDEEWILAEREQRARQCVEALEAVAEKAIARGEWGDAVARLRRALAMEPFRDSIVRRLMGAYDRSGDPGAAVEVYRELRERLRSELNAAPDPETVRLFQEIRARGSGRGIVGSAGRGDSPAQLSPTHRPTDPNTHRPPHPLTPLIGREEELEALRERLSRSRLVTMVGSGGVGKTRLAIEVATEAGEHLDESAVWVELAPLTGEDLLMPIIAAALGVRESAGDAGSALPERIGARLAGGTALLVLDNCEHLIDDAAAAAESLLRVAPNLRILATSRERLGLHGEVVWRVPSLALPAEEDLPADEHTAIERALESPAVRLFTERAELANPDFRIASREDAEAICVVCRRLDGIPLAIELAAARVGMLTPRQIMARLKDRFALLATGARTAPPRHKTLRGLIDWSYELLSPTERTALQRLSVFAGGWTLEAAEAVLNSADVLDLLTSLVSKSLVVAEPSSDYASAGTRYRLLETVREYARERLEESGEARSIRARHLACFLALAEEAAPLLLGPDSAHWLDRLEAEHDNLRAAFAFATSTEALPGVQNSQDAALRLGIALSWFWQTRGYLTEGRRWLHAALSHAGVETDPRLRARALTSAGLLADLQCESETARALFEEALGLARKLGDPLGVADALRGVGKVARTQGDHATAQARFEEILAIYRELGDRRSAARTIQNLGLIAREQGDLDRAEALYTEALTMLRDVGDMPAIALTLNSLGVIAFDRRDYDAAATYYGQALDLGRTLGEHVSLAASLHNLGMVAFARGDGEGARGYYEEALEINRAAGSRSFEAANLEGLGIVAASLRQFAEAEALVEKSLAIRRELNLRPGIAASLEAFASLCFKQQRWQEGAKFWGEAQSIREDIKSPITSARLSEYAADLAAAREAGVEVGTAMQSAN